MVRSMICSQCKSDLPVDMFYQDLRAKNGLRSNCKNCCKRNARTPWLHKNQRARRWSDEEVASVITMRRSGQRLRIIASNIERPIGSVASLIDRLIDDGVLTYKHDREKPRVAI